MIGEVLEYVERKANEMACERLKEKVNSLKERGFGNEDIADKLCEDYQVMRARNKMLLLLHLKEQGYNVTFSSDEDEDEDEDEDYYTDYEDFEDEDNEFDD